MMTKEEFYKRVTEASTKEEWDAIYDELVPPTAKKEITKNGAAVLAYLQDHPQDMATSKMIGEAIGMSSRSVSGSMRKLVTDGFVEKAGNNPVSYQITSKGIEYHIDNTENL